MKNCLVSILHMVKTDPEIISILHLCVFSCYSVVYLPH